MICVTAAGDHEVRAPSCILLQQEGAVISGQYQLSLSEDNGTRNVYCKQSMFCCSI